jgi:hypothetical protein
MLGGLEPGAACGVVAGLEGALAAAAWVVAWPELQEHRAR